MEGKKGSQYVGNRNEYTHFRIWHSESRMIIMMLDESLSLSLSLS